MPGSRHALIIATDEYQDDSLRELSSPASDAQALASVLGDPELGEFEVEVLHNRESRDIALRLEELLSDRRPQDVVLIHFSCHGLKDDSGQLYLAATDTLPARLWSTAVDATFVNRLIRKSRAGQVVLLLDCCYGGAFERGMVARAAGDVDVGEQFQQAELSPGRGRAVVTASSAMEYAFEGSHLKDATSAPPPSVFTSALTEGLRTGDADRGQDGMVDLGELYEYVYDRVREVNPHQTPSKWEYGTQGDLVIARNPNRRLAKATLPDALLSLVNDPFAATRHGAVLELQKLAAGTNLPLAAAARADLVRLQSDDSRQVGTAAKAAADATRIGVDQESVDLGSVVQGAVATRVVELRGVPLVDASRARAEGTGIVVHQVGRRITVELDTGEPGVVDAAVVVEGPAGELTVPVRGLVIAARRVVVDDQVPAPPEPVPVDPGPVDPVPVDPVPVDPVPVDPGPVDPGPVDPGPVDPVPVDPGPEPAPVDPADKVARRRARVAAAVILLATVASALTLSPAWVTGSQSPGGPPDESLVAAGAAAYLLPLVVLGVGAALLWFRGPTPLALGLAAGAAGAALVVMAQRAAALTFDGPDWAPTATFWLAFACRLVALAAALYAAWHAVPEDAGETGYAGWLTRLLAAVVVLTATIGGYVLAVQVEVRELPKDQLTASLTAALLVGLLVSFVALPPRRRQTLLAAVTTMCAIIVVSDLQQRDWWLDEVGRAKWQLIDAAAFAVLLLVAWMVQGTGTFRRPSSRR